MAEEANPFSIAYVAEWARGHGASTPQSDSTKLGVENDCSNGIFYRDDFDRRLSPQ